MRELVDLARRMARCAPTCREFLAQGVLTELPTIFDELAASRYLGRAVVTDLSH